MYLASFWTRNVRTYETRFQFIKAICCFSVDRHIECYGFCNWSGGVKGFGCDLDRACCYIFGIIFSGLLLQFQMFMRFGVFVIKVLYDLVLFMELGIAPDIFSLFREAFPWLAHLDSVWDISYILIENRPRFWWSSIAFQVGPDFYLYYGYITFWHIHIFFHVKWPKVHNNGHQFQWH